MSLTLAGIQSVVRKELLQLLRDRYLLSFIIVLPLIQLLVTGVAVQRELRHVPTLVYNYDRHNGSIELLKRLEASTFFAVTSDARVGSEPDLVRAVRSGRYRVGMIIPPDYSKQLLTGKGSAEVNLVLDGTNANVSKGILNAAQAVIANHANTAIKQNLLGSAATPGGKEPPFKLNTKVINNPDLSGSVFLIPGILGIIMHMMTVLLTSFSIVRERESGTLEQLMVSPIRVTDLMVGKVLPYAGIGLIDMLLTLGVMVNFFDISISGSFWFLLGASTLFILTSLGVGLLFSTLCRTQIQSVQLVLALLLPSLLLSGFVFPLEPMPLFIKAISYCLPLTYYLDVIRGVVIKGIGFQDLWQPTLALSTIGLLSVGLSILRFKKQVV